jgi:hypothetical protein
MADGGANCSKAASKIRLIVALSVLLIGFAVWYGMTFLATSSMPPQPRTIEQVLSALGPAERRIRPAFERAKVTWPPHNLTLLALKTERRLELYASGAEESPRFILFYPIMAASGTSGPKLREGDKQVPEGFYRIELLNPNSRYHLSLRVNYPNLDDIQVARVEGRESAHLGSDIMIHGGAVSAGCLAIGDPAVEELFLLVARVGLDNVELVIAPWDFRSEKSAPEGAHVQLYSRLQQAIESFPVP